MLDKLIAGFRQRKALRDWRASDLGHALEAHTREYFAGSYVRLRSLKDEAKNRIVEDFYAKVFALPNSENPFLALRELIANHVLAYSELSILAMTPEDKASQPYLDSPYISGELYKHIRRTSDFNEELKKLKWEYGDAEVTDEELVSYCNSRSLVLLYYANGFNLVRYLTNDHDKPKDWYRPFLKSSMIYYEDHYREKADLPRLLPGAVDGLMHMTFANFVAKGFENPYYEWEKHYAEEPA